MGNTFKLGNYVNGIFQDSSNNIGIGAAPSGSYKLEVTGTAKVSGILTLGSTISNGTFTYTLPSATGTLALTSALGDYLPLTGGTLTGALSGTSATFSSSVTAGSLIVNQASTAADIILKFQINGTNKWLVGLTNDVVDDNFTIYQDGAGGGNRFTINTSGYVGIGTSSPNGLLQLGNLQSGGQGSINGASGTINRAIINCPYPGASALTLGYYSAAYGLDIWVNGDGTGLAPVYIDQRQNEAIIFRRSTQGTAVESMRIQSGGNLLVGTTTDNGGRICATGANSTSANDSIYLENAALTVCFRVRNDGVIFTGTATRSPVNDLSGAAANLIVAAGGNLQKSTASSIRFKENVIDWIGDGLNTILALKPKTFTYKKDYYSNPQRQFLGLIAEDVAEVSTYLADYENEDGTGQVENVRYANIVVPLIAAIQELNQQNQDLKSRLDKAGL